MPPPRNILIFHAGALGDFVVTWPLALALARLHPQSRLFYVSQKGKGALAERVLRVESVDAESGWHSLFAADAPSLPEASAKRLAGAHSVVTFVAGPDDAWTRNVRRLAPHADVMPLNVPPPLEFAGHVTDHLLAQLAPWPAAGAAMTQVLRSVQSRGLPAGPAAGPSNRVGPVVIHPGSGARRKCWAPERFMDLISRIRAAGRTVRVLLGEVELETWEPAQIDRLTAAAEVAKPATYVELLDQLTGAAAFVGNDSGPTHLAGIIGLPTVALFGPSNPNHWRPLGPKVEVVAAPAMEGIEVGAVEDAVTRALRQGRPPE